MLKSEHSSSQDLLYCRLLLLRDILTKCAVITTVMLFHKLSFLFSILIRFKCTFHHLFGFLINLHFSAGMFLKLFMNYLNLQQRLVFLEALVRQRKVSFGLILNNASCVWYFQTNRRTNLRWLRKPPAKTQPWWIKPAAATAAAHLTGTEACSTHIHIHTCSTTSC